MPISRTRTKTFAPARRLGVALGLVTALTGGLLVAQAPQASALTKPRPYVAMTVNDRTIIKGQEQSVVRTRVTYRGEAVAGTARLIINGHLIKTRKLDRGRVYFRPLTKSYHLGSNNVRVVVHPKLSTGLGVKSSVARTVRVMSAGSPVARVAHQYVGAPYVYGGSSPSGFDCSGFTSYVYRKAIGKSLPRTTSGQRAAGHLVSRSSARPGDIIWTPGHVAIYVGNGKQIDAGRPGVGVVKRSIWQDNPRFVRISNAAIGA